MASGPRPSLRLEQRGDLAFGLDVGRDAAARAGRSHGGLPGRRRIVRGGLVGLVEERVAWCMAGTLRARRADGSRIEHVARVAGLPGVAPGAPAVVDAALVPDPGGVFLELE